MINKSMELNKSRGLKSIFFQIHTIGPTINPQPNKVSRVAKDVPMLLGNSEAIIEKLAVRNAAFPRASIILITKASAIKASCPGIRSRSPKSIALVPVVKTPP